MVLFRIIRARSSWNGFSPKMPMTMGEVPPEKAAGGHSTNFAKLKRKAALIWYSVGRDSCARPSPPASSSQTRLRLKNEVARERINQFSLLTQRVLLQRRAEKACSDFASLIASGQA